MQNKRMSYATNRPPALIVCETQSPKHPNDGAHIFFLEKNIKYVQDYISLVIPMSEIVAFNVPFLFLFFFLSFFYGLLSGMDTREVSKR